MSRTKPTIPRNREPCDAPSTESSKSFWHSQPSALLTGHRSTRELPATADVVIIGSGMTGTSVAHHLLTEETNDGKGVRVVMLEAREACWGATGRNGGHCQPILFEHPHDASIGHFELANFHALQNLISEKEIDCEFVAQPGVRAIYDKRNLTDTELALLSVQETAPELARMMRLETDKAELERLRVPSALAAVVTSIAARMWPYKFVARILEDLLLSTEVRGSFNLQTLTPVEGLVAEKEGWSVQTARGKIIASKVVLATNAYTSHLLPEFADLIVPCRGQMSALVPLPSVAGENRLQTSLGFMGDGLDDYLIQRPNERGGHLMFGGGRQHARSMGVTDDSEFDEETAQYLRSRLVEAFELPEGKMSAEEANACVSCRQRKVKCLRRSALKPCAGCKFRGQPCTNTPSKGVSLPKKSLEFAASHQWTGIMGFSRDDHPWIGPVPDKPNLYIAAGYTGHGMPNTWLCGKAVALMVAKTLGAPAPETELDQKFQDAGAKFDAAKKVGLPESYLVSKERVARAMDLDDVEVRDWAEMERGRRRVEGDRPHSGYA